MNDVKLLPKICKLLRHSHKLQIRYMIQYIDHHSDSLLYYHCRHLLKILCQLILCLVRSLASSIYSPSIIYWQCILWKRYFCSMHVFKCNNSLLQHMITFGLFTILKENITIRDFPWARSISSSPCSPWFSNSRLIVFKTHQLNWLFSNYCHNFLFSQLLINWWIHSRDWCMR